MSKTRQQKPVGGILLLAVLMIITVALAIAGTLEEKKVGTEMTANTQTQIASPQIPVSENTTISEPVSTGPNTSTTTVRT